MTKMLWDEVNKLEHEWFQPENKMVEYREQNKKQKKTEEHKETKNTSRLRASANLIPFNFKAILLKISRSTHFYERGTDHHEGKNCRTLLIDLQDSEKLQSKFHRTFSQLRSLTFYIYKSVYPWVFCTRINFVKPNSNIKSRFNK